VKCPLESFDGGDWSYRHQSDVLRIGRIEATRAEWIAAILDLAPMTVTLDLTGDASVASVPEEQTRE